MYSGADVQWSIPSSFTSSGRSDCIFENNIQLDIARVADGR